MEPSFFEWLKSGIGFWIGYKLISTMAWMIVLCIIFWGCCKLMLNDQVAAKLGNAVNVQIDSAKEPVLPVTRRAKNDCEIQDKMGTGYKIIGKIKKREMVKVLSTDFQFREVEQVKTGTHGWVLCRL